MPRLFTALEIPASVAENLARLRGGIPNARWIDVENYHITLRFIGDVDDAFARDAANAFSFIQRPELPVTLDQLTAFGGDKPRAIVARVRPDRSGLSAERTARHAGRPRLAPRGQNGLAANRQILRGDTLAHTTTPSDPYDRGAQTPPPPPLVLRARRCRAPLPPTYRDH